MKAKYIKPECDITLLTLAGSILDDFPIGGPSGGGLPTNEMKFDEEDFPSEITTSRSLWDE